MINFGIFMKLLAAKQLQLEKDGATLFGAPIIFCPVPFLVEFQNFLEKKYGYETARDLIVEGFKVGGSSFTRNYAKEHNFKYTRDIIQWSIDLMSNAGWGKYEILELDEKNCFARFRITNSPFTKLIKSTKPVDHIIVGLIKGVAEELVFKCPITALETKCQAKGDLFCEIILQKQSSQESKKTKN